MSVVFKEAARVVMPGGAIGILHPTVHSPPAGVTIEAIYGITTGVGFRIRAWTIYRTRHEELWEIER